MSGDSSTLEPLFTPRAVALIGSVGEGKLGFELLRQMLSGGYRDIVAINPKGALGVPGSQTIAGSGLQVDLAVIASPANTVASVLEECGRTGVKAAVVVSSGFAEAGNKAGEAELRAVAARHRIRIVGPNCAGIINTANGLTPTLETLPPRGRVAIISQSGALAGVLLGWAKRDGLGVSKFVSYGNRADVNEVDLLEYLADDVETGVIAVYVETVSDGRRDQGGPRRVGAARNAVAHWLARGQRRGVRRGVPAVRRNPGGVGRGDVRPVPRLRRHEAAAGQTRRDRHQLRRSEHPGGGPGGGRRAGRGGARARRRAKNWQRSCPRTPPLRTR